MRGKTIRPMAVVLITLLSAACGGGKSNPAVKDNNALLAGLVLSPGPLSPTFGSATTNYSGTVNVQTASVDVTATAGSAKATMTINDVAVVSGAAHTVATPVGTTTITIVVTAEDGVTTKTYGVSVSRPAVGLSPAAVDVHPNHGAVLYAVLAAPSVGTTSVALTSGQADTVTVPATVDIASGQTQAAFDASAIANGPAAVTITASLAGDEAAATVNVLSAACGNGLIDLGEQCDDGNTSDGGGCSRVCQEEAGWTCSGEPSVCSTICGDGIAAGTEECDAGGANGTTECGCQSTCSYRAAAVSCVAATQCAEASACDGLGSCLTPLNKPDGTGCTLPQASSTCQGGTCGGDGTAACLPGYGNCDGDALNGCETALDTLTDCGGCGTPCNVANGVASCATGVCTTVSCDVNYSLCSGACVDEGSDSDHCGSCDTVCSAGTYCSGGTCTAASSPLGAACVSGGECVSGFCVDGICCNTSCGGGVAGQSCQSCNALFTGGANGSCQIASPGVVCRPDAGGGCDLAESCSGSSTACPADGFRPAGIVCRAASSPCDLAETCAGTTASCPANGYASAATLCRASSCVGSGPGSTYYAPTFCDGLGTCPGSTPITCTNGCTIGVGCN